MCDTEVGNNEGEPHGGAKSEMRPFMGREVAPRKEARVSFNIGWISVMVLLCAFLYVWIRFGFGDSPKTPDEFSMEKFLKVAKGGNFPVNNYTASLVAFVSGFAALALTLAMRSWGHREIPEQDRHWGPWLRRVIDEAHREKATRILLVILAVACGEAVIANGYYLWQKGVHDDSAILMIFLIIFYIVVASLPAIVSGSENVGISGYAYALQRVARIESYAYSLPVEFGISQREGVYERKRVRGDRHSDRGKLCGATDAFKRILGLESWFSWRLLAQFALVALPGFGFIVLGLLAGAIWGRGGIVLLFVLAGILTLVNSLFSECLRGQIFSAAVDGYRGGGSVPSVWMSSFLVVLWILVWELTEGSLVMTFYAAGVNLLSAPGWWPWVLAIQFILTVVVPLVWGVLVWNTVRARRPTFHLSHFRRVVLEKCDRNIELFEEFDPIESEVDLRDLAVVANLVAANELYVERRVSSRPWYRCLFGKRCSRAENRKTDLCIRLRDLVEGALKHPLPVFPVDRSSEADNSSERHRPVLRGHVSKGSIKMNIVLRQD
jgi:membrane protein